MQSVISVRLARLQENEVVKEGKSDHDVKGSETTQFSIGNFGSTRIWTVSSFPRIRTVSPSNGLVVLLFAKHCSRMFQTAIANLRSLPITWQLYFDHEPLPTTSSSFHPARGASQSVWRRDNSRSSLICHHLGDRYAFLEMIVKRLRNKSYRFVP